MLREFARAHDLQCVSDQAGNTVIRRPGSGGGEGAPTVVLQNHVSTSSTFPPPTETPAPALVSEQAGVCPQVDMVCVKGKESPHDFERDPIKLVLDGGWGADWLTADSTTLGSDNGVGAAMALSVLQLPATAALPPLEALFTVNEETGLTGVQKLDPGIVAGRRLINLDTEQWGDICVGCAGTGTSTITVPVSPSETPDGGPSCGVQVSVTGLLGGHSGADISTDRANAIKLLARLLLQLQSRFGEALALVELSGGDLRNSIPCSATAKLRVPASSAEDVLAAARRCEASFRAEYGTVDTALAVQGALLPDLGAQPALSADSASRLLTALHLIPQGVIKYSHAMPGLPETSNNLSVVRAGSTEYVITTTTRSSLPDSLESVRRQLAMVATLCKGEANLMPAYSGWQPSLDSPLLRLTREEYEAAMGGKPAQLRAVHAGLECGVLCGLLEGLDAVSFGPEIRGAHSVDERCQISTVSACYDLLLRILTRLSLDKDA